MNFIRHPRTIAIALILLSSSYAVEISRLSKNTDTWSLKEDLAEKKLDAEIGTYVSFMALKFESPKCPLKVVIFDILVTSAPIAVQFGIPCTSQYGLKINTKMKMIVMLKDKTNENILFNALNKIKNETEIDVSKKNSYTVDIILNPYDYSATTTVFQKIITSLALSDIDQEGFDYTHHRLESLVFGPNHSSCQCRIL